MKTNPLVGLTFDIIFCMSRFNHVPSGDTLRRDVISSYFCSSVFDVPVLYGRSSDRSRKVQIYFFLTMWEG